MFLIFPENLFALEYQSDEIALEQTPIPSLCPNPRAHKPNELPQQSRVTYSPRSLPQYLPQHSLPPHSPSNNPSTPPTTPQSPRDSQSTPSYKPSSTHQPSSTRRTHRLEIIPPQRHKLISHMQCVPAPYLGVLCGSIVEVAL